MSAVAQKLSLSLKRILSSLFLTWYVPLLRKGWAQEPIGFSDLEEHVPLDKAAYTAAGLRLRREWKAELDFGHWSLFRAILRTFRFTVILTGVIRFVEKCVLNPLDRVLLCVIINHFSTAVPSPDQEAAYVYASWALIAIMGLRLYSVQAYYLLGERLGSKIKTAAASLLYSKALRLNHQSLRDCGTGRLINLLSGDGTRLETIFEAHFIWVGPVQLCILSWSVWQYFGPSCLLGLLYTLFLGIFQGYLGKKLGKCRVDISKASDRRLKLMSEIIHAIRTIKMYAWELPFSKLLEKLRRKELELIQNHYRLRLINWCNYCSSSSIPVFLTIGSFVLSGNTLTAEKLFLCISMYSQIRVSVTIEFPKALAQLTDFAVAVRRYQDFLLLPELDPKPDIRSDEKVRIVAEDIGSSWASDSKAGSCHLSGFNLEVTSPKLISIIGGVGTGKSTLLLTLLKELPITSGRLTVFGRTAYVPQQPWIFAGSIQENILFGRTLRPEWYAEVIEACALGQDLSSFPSGDSTVVSEGGSTLSGGQQARVSLARAVYADADIYFLDTPLCSVDPKVGKHVLDHCINGLLKNKIRVAVTHHLDLIRSSDLVYHLEDGRVTESGSPEEVIGHNTDHLGFVGLSMTNNNPEETPDSHCSVSVLNRVDPHQVGPVLFSKDSDSSVQGVSKGVYYDYFKAGIFSSDILVKIVAYTAITHFLMFASEYSLKHSVRQDESSKLPWNAVLQQVVLIFAINGSLLIVSALQMSTFMKICTAAGNKLHDKMFTSVVRAPIGFFVTKSEGNILQRFSSDTNKVDEVLPFTLFYGFHVYIRCFIGILAVILTTNRLMIFPGTLLIIIVILLQRIHVRTARSLSFLDFTAKSPLLSHLSSSVHGITTIRAFELQKEMEAKFWAHLDLQSRTQYARTSALTWISATVDLAVNLFIVALIIGLMFFKVNGVEIGLALSSAFAFSAALSMTAAYTSTAEYQMRSAENILSFHEVEPERSSDQVQPPPKGWPSAGEITLKNVSLSYDKEFKALKNITLRVSAGQKVGIVGRTGAGKSSLLAALFRLHEPTGLIEIDGIDITTIGLHDLRPRLSIIPQDPVLFQGTLRSNLDPFTEFSDEAVAGSLHTASLEHFVQRHPLGIQMKVDEGGKNLSVGEAQLICMARAILRRSKVLISDEPTSNVDLETSTVIQEKIEEVFKGSTVLTIAHRVSTIMSCDKVIVMQNGEIKEFDSPKILLQNPRSFFSQHISTCPSPS